MEKKFGFYPHLKSFSTGNIRVDPLPSLEDVVAAVKQENRITNDWFYPPLVEKRLTVGLISPIKPDQAPVVPTTRYQLPPTHIIIHKQTRSTDRINFLILCVGFLLGMRLLPEGWGHFYRTPVEEHKLTDLIVGKKDVERCLPLFDKFWIDNNDRVRRMMFSAVNIFQLAKSYEHQYEEFVFQYVALDSIYRLFVECGHIPEKNGFIIERGKRRRVSHWERPRLICRRLGTPLPDWARKKRTRTANTLSEVRNNLIHEGMIGQKSIGFGGIEFPGMLLSIDALICRSLLYLLGLRDPYISSPTTTRQMHGLQT